MHEKAATLTGSFEFHVNHSNGDKSVVKVRQLPIKEFPKFLQVQDDELEMIDFVCGKTKGFAETLTPECHEALVAEIEKVNADFFLRWVERRKARVEKLAPGAFQKALTNHKT